MNSAVKSLVLAAGQHGVELSVDKIMYDFALKEDQFLGTAELITIARKNNLKAKSLKASWADILKLNNALPVLVRLKNGHYIILSNVKESEEGEYSLSVLDPLSSKGQLELIDKDKFLDIWSGDALLLKPAHSLSDESMPFSLRWIFKEFYQQKLILVQMIGIALLLNLFAMLPIVYVMIVLDKVVNYEAHSTLYVIAVGVFVAHLFSGVVGYLKQYVALFFVSKLEAKLNGKVFSSVIDQPLTYFQTRSPDSIIQSAQQVSAIRHFLLNKVFGTILDASSLLIFLPILILFSPALFGVVFVFSLLIALNNTWGAKRQKDLLKNVNQHNEDKSRTLSNAVMGIDSVKTLALEPALKREWEAASVGHTLAAMEQGKANAISSQISSTLQQLMTVVVIFIGVLMVFAGNLSPGVLIGINMLANKVTGPLVQLVSLSTDMGKFLIAVEKIQELLSLAPANTRRGISPPISGQLSLKGVGFAYESERSAIDNVSFEIKPRQKVAIVGPSGAGKTTLLRLIQGQVKPSEGNIYFDENDIRSIDSEYLRVNVSMVSAKNTFFHASIRSNVLHPMPTATQDRLVWAYRMSGLEEDLLDLPDGDDTVIEEGASNLPTSLLQKVALARALIRNPKVLLFDEMFSGLSLDDEIRVKNKIPEIIQGRTIVMVTHQLYQTTDFDQILVLNGQGQLVEQGTHNDLLTLQGDYATMWHKEVELHQAYAAQASAEVSA